MLVRILRQRPMDISCPEAKQSKNCKLPSKPQNSIAFPTATGAKFKFLVILGLTFFWLGREHLGVKSRPFWENWPVETPHLNC